MEDHLYIVTGSSRGLGRAIVEQLLDPHHRVLGVSRRPEPGLEALARERAVPLMQWPQDLAQPLEAALRLESWLSSFEAEAFPTGATLINNAATLLEPGPLESATVGELSTALRIGLEAPTLLTDAFLRATRRWPGTRRVLLISSGLARRPMAGCAAYAAVKAGLDQLARCVALEQQAPGQGGARIVSLAPGVVDTAMQAQLRNADSARFADRVRFERLAVDGQLAAPAAAASAVLAYLARDDFGREPVADVRDGG